MIMAVAFFFVKVRFARVREEERAEGEKAEK